LIKSRPVDWSADIAQQPEIKRLALIRTSDRIKSYPTFKEYPMRTTQQFSVTLPNEMAAQVRAKVAAGEYASESEVIRDGLRALQAREKAVESWLRNDVAPAHDALRFDPSRARSIKDVKATLSAEHTKGDTIR